MSQEQDTGARVGDRLLAHKERIISVWVARVRAAVPAAGREAHPVLVDTLPAVLDQLAEAFAPRSGRQLATAGSTVASEHGGERVRVTHFRLEDLITEYSLLRRVLFEVLDEEGPLSADERDILNGSLDLAVKEACTGYALVQSGLRDQLFAIVAHDLRNPLSAALTSASLILRKPNGDQVPRWAARIVDNIGRVDRMVQDLLDAVRVQTGERPQLQLEECDLVEAVRETLDELRTQHGDRFVLEAPAPVRGHLARDALRRALENLLTNAIKYGSATEPIEVTVELIHGRALISVHNGGPHIPVEKQETLFRAFQRSDAAEKSGQRGWGLGLAQVRAVAEAHGGSIAVSSLPGRGTTFVIDVPADARPFQDRPITHRV
ncbi:MAG: HAMP domain-containing sensor histidine kinase [Myxococcaceae bacterium]